MLSHFRLQFVLKLQPVVTYLIIMSAPMCQQTNCEKKKRGWPKGRKRRKLIKDENAPKKPVNAYVVFMSSRREHLSKLHPNLSFAEITKLVGEEWSTMDDSEKRIYVDAAEREKEKYLKHLEEYKQSEKYKLFLQRSQETQGRHFSSSSAGGKAANDIINKRLNRPLQSLDGSDIPIFTEAFLDYNKAKESELHRLNRANTECEQQNTVLETHIMNLQAAVQKLEAEIQRQNTSNRKLEAKLDHFRKFLLSAFHSIPSATTSHLPTVDTIDEYLSEVCSTLQSNIASHNNFARSIQNVVATVDLKAIDYSSASEAD